MARHYVPARGDAIWITLQPQAGHEQAGRRPALVLSPASYNSKVGLAIICPITSQIKGYPFEVLVPAGLKVSGAVLSDQAKSLDWRVRKAELICRLPLAGGCSFTIWLLFPRPPRRARSARGREQSCAQIPKQISRTSLAADYGNGRFFIQNPLGLRFLDNYSSQIGSSLHAKVLLRH